ncbi:MAG: hypothetical protein ABIY70_24885 [Capsulimonas sp.]|uniref:anti-sigma factor family protein n=1 Tax=Capsulimonas sp. TaxID=2494211 RepID=UPI003262F2E5
MTEQEAREQFSAYLEDELDPDATDRFQSYLAANPECAAELIDFERTVALIHRLPAHEPALDLWTEFAPRMAEVRKEMKMGIRQRWRFRWFNFLSSVSAGVILYTHALAERTHGRLERYLLQDPFHVYEGRGGDGR